MSFRWTCPYCNHKCTIGGSNYDKHTHVFDLNNKFKNKLGLESIIIVCPNSECEEITIGSALYKSTNYREYGYQSPPNNPSIYSWKLLPHSHAKPFPSYIPAPILNDYNEACAISDLSPKASATLARRCLQGMIRDYWGIVDKTLYKEINALEDKVSEQVWESLNAVREIGNIGAHMEQDINIIVDVEADEAKILIELLEILFEEWYIARYERNLKLSRIQQIRDTKKAIKEQ
ncbi:MULTISPECIES: DUF4145 domain-containing protein [Acinetobacter]|uniref:DUF4145 domain-containing protein n=1 Tax=Acinetobacter TaxID=469 RepID=UPI0010231938|nr:MULTISPECIES: DUF4145 domain-containing protein [Acinetobacter]MDS7927880.1 DUF4145 domain-containing protein [Acinetobacter sp. V115_6]RZH13017.1 DUF4145 domain-containing protein [Acinetobacter pittii]